MAVLVEAISVITRRSAIDEKYPGGWQAFAAHVPNRTLCADSTLARVGFMTPPDVGAFVDHLENAGLEFVANGTAVDLVVVDQQTGPTTACDWAYFGHVCLDGDPDQCVAACVTDTASAEPLITPDGWRYEQSLSRTFIYTPDEAFETSLERLGRRDGLDVFRSRLTGQPCYMGRATMADSGPPRRRPPPREPRQ